MKKLVFLAVVACALFAQSCTEQALNDESIEQVDRTEIDRPGNQGGGD